MLETVTIIKSSLSSAQLVINYHYSICPQSTYKQMCTSKMHQMHMKLDWKLFTEQKTLREHRPPPRRIWSGSGADDFQNLTGTSLWQNVHEYLIIFSRDMSQIVEKCTNLTMLKNPSKKSWIRSGSGRLPNFDQFFYIHRYICGKIFMNIRSVVFK